MRKSSRWPSYGLTLAVLLAAVVILLQRQNIIDWWRIRQYQEPAAAAQLATDTAMTSKGRHLWLSGRPQLNDKSTFGSHCQIQEQSIVLGCYTGYQQIFLLTVDDRRLDGVEQVTAAHEMLHAAYDRMGASQKASVDAMVTEAYNNMHDSRLTKTIDQYKVTEPNDIANELHSILGTEIKALPPALETYYKQYFADRQKIVSYAQNYEDAFLTRENQIKDIESQLASLKAKIDALQNELSSQRGSLDEQRAGLDRLEKNGDIAGYNTHVPTFNAAVRGYNSSIQKYKTYINQYNSLVTQHNDLVTQEQQLVQALDANSVGAEQPQ
jgi:uncharacterized coiled-coil protein SlyX